MKICLKKSVLKSLCQPNLFPWKSATLRDWDYVLNDETGQFVIIDTDKNKAFIVNDMFANYCDELLGILTK